MSSGQVGGVVLVVTGVALESIDGWVAVLISLVAMVFWAVETILTRLGEMWGSPQFLGVILRMACLPFSGVFIIVLCHGFLKVPFLSTDLLLLAAYNAIAPSTTLWSLIRAFAAPQCNTG